jgi:hypothetical protein
MMLMYIGKWPAHQPRRIILTPEKLCPVHRGLIVKFHDMVYTSLSVHPLQQEFSGERSTAVERSPLRSISCTRVRQK